MAAISVWFTVHVFSVVGTSISKRRPTSQKPESLKWLQPTEPAAVAKTTQASCQSLKPAAATAGAINAAAVVNATVAEPCAIRNAKATKKQPSNTGMPKFAMLSANA